MSVFEVDITSIVNNMSIAIVDIKQKLDLLKTFQGQDVSVEITETEGNHLGNFTFADQYSSLRIVLPTPEYVDNKFMPEEERDSIFGLSEENLILECDISQLITDRISAIATNFNVKTIRIGFDGEAAELTSSTQSKDQFAKFISGIETNMVMEPSSAYVTVIPFAIDHDTDIELKMYKDPNQDVALNVFSTQLGEFDINIYTRASIIRDNE